MPFKQRDNKMNYNPNHHNRRSIRLQEYDYSQPGWYYITICTYKKKCLFGNLSKGIMLLNEYGKIAEKEWMRTKEIRINIDLDYFVIMPNHIHGIIIIENKINIQSDVGANCNSPLHSDERKQNKLISPTQTLGAIIRGFKGCVTKKINEMRNTPASPVWQRNYYEHILRNETDLYFTRNYIQNNPLKWDKDELYLNNV